MSKANDFVNNWTAKIPKEYKNDIKLDKTYPTHLIKPCSMILSIGATGGGKTNSVVEFLHRSKGKWYEILVFTGSNTDEPIYNFLKNEIPEMSITNDPEELPKIEDYQECDKGLERLIIFDDSVMSDPKTLKNICKWFMMSRKLGFTTFFLSQSYHSVPTFIRRNIHYLHLFKISDNADLKKIHSKIGEDLPFKVFQNIYRDATANVGNFLNIDLRANSPQTKYKKNFIGII